VIHVGQSDIQQGQVGQTVIVGHSDDSSTIRASGDSSTSRASVDSWQVFDSYICTTRCLFLSAHYCYSCPRAVARSAKAQPRSFARRTQAGSKQLYFCTNRVCF
jgi:hypothetical protein